MIIIMINVIMMKVIMISVFLLNIVMLNIVKLDVVMLNVITLNVIMMYVVAPETQKSQINVCICHGSSSFFWKKMKFSKKANIKQKQKTAIVTMC
jgi:hypothetical protein